MRRRLITVFAVLALGVSALAGAAPAVAADPGAVYVALGDSEAAGTGNLPYVDSACMRSKKAYPMLLGASLGTGVESNACAGATTEHVIALQLGDLGVATRLVTITVGANDIGWLNLLMKCTTGSALECAQAQGETAAALANLPTEIGTMVAAVRMAAPNALIVVTGYPLLFGDVTSTCSIGAFEGSPVKVTAQQAALANFLVSAEPPAGLGLNAAIAAGVAGYSAITGDTGVMYLDVAAGFDGHGLCDTGDRWISGLVSGNKTFDRGLHANSPGQAAFATIIAAALPPLAG